MKIKHNDAEYELNIEKAIADGYLKKVREKITTLRPGDVFTYSEDRNHLVVIHQVQWNTNLYVMGGLYKKPFSLFASKPEPMDKIIEWLNDNNAVFVRNLDVPLDLTAPKV